MCADIPVKPNPMKKPQGPPPVGDDPNKPAGPDGPKGPQQVQVIQGNTPFLTVKLLNDAVMLLKEIKAVLERIENG
jgi:glycosyltransferase A (GT-A) superfamily protein (DUF2064 family)